MADDPQPDDDVLRSAEALRADIRDGGRDSVRALSEFASRFAADRALQDEALVLNLDAPEGDPDQAFIVQMLTLVDRVVEDHASAGGAEAVRKRERAYVRLREHFERKAPSEEVAFLGEALVKAYPGTDFMLGEVSLGMRLGEITGVVGQNAHGKTTLLRMVAGELRPDRGTLSYPLLRESGDDIDWVQVKQSLAFVPQELPPWSGSLRDTLHFEAALHGILGQDNEREVSFVVERLGLGGYLDKRWAELSGGYKLRFALARALVWKPRLLIMDEPLANLDVKAKSVLLQDVRDLARSYRYPIAVLMSSHELHGLEAVCQQMVFLNKGEVVYVGPSESVGSDLSRNEYELGTTLKLADLRERLAGSGVEEIREEGVSFMLRTRAELDHRALLALLLERDVDVQYFRDNSRSVRRLFQ